MENELFNGWKEIANYLGRGVRTVQRWERLNGLPVHRPAGKQRAAVFALKLELDAWLSHAWQQTPEADPQLLRVRLEQLEQECARLRAMVSNKLPAFAAGFASTVLAVDDNEACRYVVTRCIERGGHRAIAASNGVEALALAELHKPALVLLDVNMPEMLGYEVCRQLKENPNTADIPVIFLSATDRNPSAIERAMSAGGETFLVSPVHPEQLLATIHATLAKQTGVSVKN